MAKQKRSVQTFIYNPFDEFIEIESFQLDAKIEVKTPATSLTSSSKNPKNDNKGPPVKYEKFGNLLKGEFLVLRKWFQFFLINLR